MNGPAGVGAAGLLQVAVSLAVILGLIVALAWVAKRLRLAPRVGQGAIRVLADLPVGQKERVMLLQVGDRQALVGVGADGLRALSLLEVQVTLPSAGPAGEESFADRLKSVLERAQAMRAGSGGPQP